MIGDPDRTGTLFRDHPAMKPTFLAIACLIGSSATVVGQSNGPVPPTTGDVAPVREGPQVLVASAVGVGRMVTDADLKRIDGTTIRLADIVGENGLVIAMTNTSCPLCKKYGPTLADLEKELAARKIPVLYVNPTSNESAQDMAAFVATHRLRGPYVHDADGSFARSLAATSTTEVILIDRRRTIVYRGAVDDQYGLGYALDAPRQTYLRDAVKAMLADRDPNPAATTAPGCELDLSSAKATPPDVTYHNRISRIVQANCVECHRDGGVGPFPLDSYEAVVAHAGMIRKVVARGTMPPWFAAPAKPDGHSPWANDRSLSAEDKSALLTWLGGDRPQGDPADAPAPKTFAEGWLIGPPDAVFAFPKPVPVKATGTMPYQHVTVETDLTEDKWVRAIEVRPGDPSVVHHVIVSLRGAGEQVNERDGYWGIYVPGNSTLVYPEGFAKLLPKGAKLRFQMHYTPNGTATEDVTRIGVVFADGPPDHEVKVAGIANAKIRIPPGAENHREEAKLKLPMDATILGYLPHMHLRGKACEYVLIPADGDTRTLLSIPRYDFNWQLQYRYAEPLPLKAGDTIRFRCWFDNSENNPANPDPTWTVRWGQQTFDEMHLGYVEYYVPGVKPGGSPSLKGGRPAGGGAVASAIFRRADADNDGAISRPEYDRFTKRLPRFRDDSDAAAALFKRLDADKDGAISATEFEKLSSRN